MTLVLVQFISSWKCKFIVFTHHNVSFSNSNNKLHTYTCFHNRPGNCEHWLPLCRPPRWWKALWSSWMWVYTVVKYTWQIKQWLFVLMYHRWPSEGEKQRQRYFIAASLVENMFATFDQWEDCIPYLNSQ